MGFAINRPDGTYRSWESNAQSAPLLPGETVEQLDVMPAITAPAQPNESQLEAGLKALGM